MAVSHCLAEREKMKRNLTAPFLFAALSVGGGSLTVSAQTRTNARAMVAEAAKDDALTGDARLSRRIDFRCAKAKISDILMELRTYTNARLITTEDRGNITLHVTNAAVRDVMDSVATLYNSAWKYEGNKWVLSFPKSDPDKDCNPSSAEEAEEYARGRALLDAASKLPPQLKQRFASDTFAPPSADGVLLSELPKEMQDLAQSMYQYARRNETESPAEREKLPETLSDCHVWMNVSGWTGEWNNRSNTTHQLVLNLGPSGAASGNVDVHAHFITKSGPNPDYSIFSSEERDALAQKAMKSTIASYEAPKKSREKALAEDNRMNFPITLDMDRVSFLTAIQTLARVANISVATTETLLDDNLRTFHFNKTPLHEVLNQIVAAYAVKTDAYGKVIPADAPEPDYTALSPEKTGRRITVGGKPYKPASSAPTIVEWGWRKSGMFLFTSVPPSQSWYYTQAKEKIAKASPADGVKPAPSK